MRDLRSHLIEFPYISAADDGLISGQEMHYLDLRYLVLPKVGTC